MSARVGDPYQLFISLGLGDTVLQTAEVGEPLYFSSLCGSRFGGRGIRSQCDLTQLFLSAGGPVSFSQWKSGTAFSSSGVSDPTGVDSVRGLGTPLSSSPVGETPLGPYFLFFF